jgi:hypothetical protein
MTTETNDDTHTPRRTIPIDGALAALRERMAPLRVGRTLTSAEYFDVLGALECLGEAILQAQAAERATHPPLVVTTDTSAKARAEAAYDTWAAGVRSLTKDGPTMLEIWQAVVRAVDASRPQEDPEFARVHMTPLDKLRAIAGLVKLLPAGDYPSLWLGTREAYELAAALPGASLRATSAQQHGMVIHSAFVDVDGLEVRAHYLTPDEPPTAATSREPVSP